MGDSRTATQTSDPVFVDHTPPVIERAEFTSRGDGRIELRVVARDPSGRLAKAEVARAPGAFEAMTPGEGLGDGARETWVAVLPAPANESELLVRVVDAAGNSATALPEKK